MLFRQGDVLPWRKDICERSHTKQLQQTRQKDKSFCQTIRRHLLVFDGAIQVLRSRVGERVSPTNSSLEIFREHFITFFQGRVPSRLWVNA